MDLYRKQLDVYKEIVNGGLYDVHGVKILIDLIKEKGYPEFLHDELVKQLTDAVNSIEKTRFDKISVVMKASERAAKNLMKNFITKFQSENVTVTTIDYSKVPRERIPYKYRLRIYWKDTRTSVSLYFVNKYSNNVSNIKIDFNLTKSRNESLSAFSFIYNNLPETKALKIFHKATITRLERYFLLSNIPVWGALCSRSRLVKGTESFDARGNNNGVAASYYISKDNSKEIIVYDKFASDSKMDDDDPQKYEKSEDGTLKEAFQKLVADLSKVETKVEVRNFKNRMNKKQRKKSLFFCSPSTFPRFLRDVQFYSPLLFKELSKSQLSKLIGSGFYNLIKTDKLNTFNKSRKIFEKYKIEIDKEARKSLESNFSLVFYAFLQDLGKEIGQSVFDPDKPFSKKRKNKIRNEK